MDPLLHGMPGKSGWIEIICGSMFSGKTEELIRRLRRARIARQRVAVFKPALDTRFSSRAVVSHDDNSFHSTLVSRASDLLASTRDVDVVGIDEAQFFDAELVGVCEEMARAGVRVIVAGLDQDYLGRPFEPVPQLMAVAEYVTKLHAVCVACGGPASHSQRVVPGDERMMLGGAEQYEPRCRQCFEPSRIPATTAPPSTP